MISRVKASAEPQGTCPHMTDPDLTSRDTFRHWTPGTIRYSDQDAMAHVNNTAMAAYVEAARCAFIYDLIRTGGIQGLEFILARLVIDYRHELHYPGTVEVGARLIRLGNKSLTTGFGIFMAEDCIAISESVNVFYDLASRKTVAPSARIREILRAEMEG
jgi:acyl-CoA thioester hydrolase